MRYQAFFNSPVRSMALTLAATLMLVPSARAQQPGQDTGNQPDFSRPPIAGPPRKTLADLTGRNRWMQPSMAMHDLDKEVDLGNGLKYVDLYPGDESIRITPGSFVGFDFNVFKPDGTFVYSSRQPGHKPAGARISDADHDGTMFPAWEKAMIGMNLRCVRKILIPQEMLPDPNGFGPLPGDTPLVIEAGVFAIAPPIDRATAGTGKGFVYSDVVQGDGQPFVTQGYASCQLTVFNEKAELMGSTHVARKTISTPGDADRYWVKFALGTRPGGSRVIEFDEPEAYRKLRGLAPDAQVSRWRMIIDTRTVNEPILLPKYDPKDARPINDGGVKIVDLKVGDGAEFPEKGFTATIDYSVWFEDTGELYDSTRKPGASKASYSPGLHPAPIQLALKGMKVGGKRLLIVPAGFRVADDFSALPDDRPFIYEIDLDSFEEAIFLFDDPGQTIIENITLDEDIKAPSKP